MKGAFVMSVKMGRITSKFQITLPSEIRDAVGAHVGDQVLFHVNDQGEIVIRPLKKSSLDQVYGALHREGAPYIPLGDVRSLTSDEMAEKFAKDEG